MNRFRAAIAATVLTLLLPLSVLAHSATPGPCETFSANSAPGFTLVLTDGPTFGPFVGEGPYTLHVAGGTYPYQFYKADGSKDKEGFGTLVIEPCPTPTPEVTPTPTPTPEVTPTPTPSQPVVTPTPSHPVVTPTPHHTKTPPPTDTAPLATTDDHSTRGLFLIIVGLLVLTLVVAIEGSLRRERARR